MKRATGSPFQTILVLVVAALIAYWRWRYDALLYGGTFIGVAGLFSSLLRCWIHQVWMGFAGILSRIFPPVWLGLIYCVILVPIAFLARWLGPDDPLRLKKREGSLFRETDKDFSPESFEQPW